MLIIFDYHFLLDWKDQDGRGGGFREGDFTPRCGEKNEGWFT